MYRRALARVIRKDEDEAEKDLVEASKLVPEDGAIAGELAKVRQRKKEKRDKEKKAFKKMFAFKKSEAFWLWVGGKQYHSQCCAQDE